MIQGEVQAVERRTEQGAHLVEVVVDLGGGELATVDHMASPGDDSLPLPGDTAALVEGPRSGDLQAVGYADTVNEGKANPGEVRRVSRNQQGVPVGQLWMMNDGTFLLEVLGTTAPFKIKTAGPVIVDSPDVTLGGTGGRKVACLGDIASGVVAALSTSPTNPIAPAPPGTPGVPIALQIVSACANVEAF